MCGCINQRDDSTKESNKINNSKKKKSFDEGFYIEGSFAKGLNSMVDAFVEGAINLSKKDREAYAKLLDIPFFADNVRNNLMLMKHEKGFFTKWLYKFWEKLTNPFHAYLQNKRLRRALDKSNRSNPKLGDW